MNQRYVRASLPQLVDEGAVDLIEFILGAGFLTMPMVPAFFDQLNELK